MTELVRLKHCNPRLAFSEVVGGGKSSEAAANDRDVNAIAPVQSSRRCAFEAGHAVGVWSCFKIMVLDFAGHNACRYANWP